jgi:hypothetical protein
MAGKMIHLELTCQDNFYTEVTLVMDNASYHRCLLRGN